MATSDLNILGAFLMAAEERSFTKAAKRLGVSPSAISHAIRGLEEGLGVCLLSRTTRSVAPTEAGQELLLRLRPALTDIEDALDKLSGFANSAAVAGYVPDSGARSDNGSRGFPVPGRKPGRWKRRHTS
jgi:DNA-binding transcriptional LysR family regulator